MFHVPISDLNVSDSDLCPHDMRFRAALNDLPGWQIFVRRCGAHLNEDAFNDIHMRHPNWGFYICDRPGMYLERAAQRHPVTTDTITVIPPWLDFTYHFSKRHSSGHAYIHVDIPRLPSGLTQGLFDDFLRIADSDCVAAMQQWARRFSLENPDPVLVGLEAQQVSSQIMTRLVLSLNDEQRALIANPGLHWQRLEPALDYIKHHLAESIAISDLSQQLECGKEHCIRLFKQVLKQTPTQFILSQRVERAVRLLVASDASLEDIAQRCGFANRHYMSRVFKRQMGLSPAQYRRLA